MNMDYCKYRNALQDLEYLEDEFEDTADLSEEEKHARFELIKLCRDIAKKYGEEV